MMETSGGPRTMSCAEAEVLLEKELTGETLLDTERSALRRHLSSCGSCSGMVKLTNGLPKLSDDLTADEIEDAIQSVLSNLNTYGDTKRRGKPQRRIVAALAAAAILFLTSAGIYLARAEETDDTTVVASYAADTPRGPSMDAFPVAQQTTDRPAPPATAPIDSLIQDAQSCLIAQEWRCAAAKYREALTHYAGRPESLALLISLAKLELQHLGAPRQALEHYKTYQRRAPDGPLAEESLYGIAKVYRRLGLIDDEVQTLDRFIDTYPRSPLSNKARARLLQLGRIERQP